MKTNLMIVPMLVLLFCFQLAWGKTLYRYQRDDGVIVTTDHFDNVPEKYRKSVEKIVEPDENPITLKMKENVAKGWPGATGFTFWKSEFDKLVMGISEDLALQLFGKPKNVSGSAGSGVKTWGYDSASTGWYVRDDATNTVAKTVILTLRLKNQSYYVVDIFYSR